MGKLKRMTTWKVRIHIACAGYIVTSRKSRLATSRNANDESEVDESHLNAGLFTYPVLQAADILLYKCVPLEFLYLSESHHGQGHACPRR